MKAKRTDPGVSVAPLREWVCIRAGCRLFFHSLLLLTAACSSAAPVFTEWDAELRGEHTPPDGLRKTMRLVPAGYSYMGSAPEDPGARADEFPQRLVGVSSFYLDESPVSYRDFAAYVRAAGSPRSHYQDYSLYNRPAHPVTGMNWYEAACFCNWRSQMAGLEAVYRDSGDFDSYGYPIWERRPDANGFRLPTEAEFERAARGNATERAALYPWGDRFDPRLANLDEGRGAPRGRWWRLAKITDGYQNSYGLYGMSGNVWEWSDDNYAPDRYASAPDTNPRGPASPERPLKSMRGGSWGSWRPADLRVARRSYSAPGAYHFDAGFRCLLPAATARRQATPGLATAVRRETVPGLPALCRAPVEADTGRVTSELDFASADDRPARRRFGPEFRDRLAAYLRDYFAESLYFQTDVDGQPALEAEELADLILAESLAASVHPLFLTGVMRAESGVGTVSFPRWFNNPMAYHWQNRLMSKGLPQYVPMRGRNRRYRTLREGFAAFAQGIRREFYIEAARGDLSRFHKIYVGYDAPEWMVAVTTVYREVLGVDFTPTAPARNCGRWIYLDWDRL